MNPDAQKQILAKRIISAGWLVAAVGATLVTRAMAMEADLPLYAVIVYNLATILMIYGVYKGSKGAGLPLDRKRFFSLLLGYPCWIPALIYLITLLVTPAIFGLQP